LSGTWLHSDSSEPSTEYQTCGIKMVDYERSKSRTSGLYCTCIYEAAAHTVQGDDTEGKPLRTINVCLEVSLLAAELN
jgi:hypothetical protein